MIINGAFADAVVFTDTLDVCSAAQIKEICDNPALRSAKIRVMPDCHAGKGCIIGFTSVSDRRIVIPNIVGADIGCGILTTIFTTESEIDFRETDNFIRENIPSSTNIRRNVHSSIASDAEFISDMSRISGIINAQDYFEHDLLSLGTLGGGNHFIEIGRLSGNRFALFVHTGSRGFGNRICRYFQRSAEVVDSDERRRILAKHSFANTPEEHAAINEEAAALPRASRETAFIKNELYDSYIECMLFARDYAARNRAIISDSLMGFLEERFGAAVCDRFDTIHNYIEYTDENNTSITIRKGAVSAKNGERLVIPLNMRDGVIIACGKGNTEWNCSAPHGAGRLLSRSDARRLLSMDEYAESMKGINSWSVCPETIDEAPQAYKPAEEIIDAIGDTVTITETAKPLYNFKAS